MSTGYRAPPRDMLFVIDEWLDAPALWRRVPEWTDLDASSAQQVLDDAARFVTGRVAPLDASGDLDGCRFDIGDAPCDDPFRTDKRSVGAYFFD
ncbi:acyl-CoA dehydrogenase N-terminal domain-containing protein [Burkholderia sp. BCC0405]|uniref:acyl-CoA dehydrogenase N-terminal domain-containing protein n=1 Tax=Burkholderia sp. BCC0405 TaxID=2676298 RepID=UPI0015896381|nr:acyl-CoA dehydrogenase N-terminal domain-containing protein [Burkholderia sp. BCC0405]